MTKILNERITKQVQEAFEANLEHPVEVLYFGQEQDCDYCDDNRRLLEEVTALSPKLQLKTYDLSADAEVAKKYQVTQAPVTVIAARNGEQVHDYGIRLKGIPAGHEFSTLIQDMILVSGRDSGLEPQTRDFLHNLQKPVHLQVFVTPT